MVISNLNAKTNKRHALVRAFDINLNIQDFIFYTKWKIKQITFQSIQILKENIAKNIV